LVFAATVKFGGNVAAASKQHSTIAQAREVRLQTFQNTELDGNERTASHSDHTFKVNTAVVRRIINASACNRSSGEFTRLKHDVHLNNIYESVSTAQKCFLFTSRQTERPLNLLFNGYQEILAPGVRRPGV
jgi:hypothetical protein